MKARDYLSELGVILPVSFLAACLLLACTGAVSFGKKASSTSDGKKEFKMYCAECHEAGGNKIKPSRAVAGSQKLATLATFKAYLEAPVGHMPYYPHLIKDKTVLEALYKYCKSLPKGPAKEACADTVKSHT
jgi:mono/diheme cytochrome c family protein